MSRLLCTCGRNVPVGAPAERHRESCDGWWRDLDEVRRLRGSERAS